MRLVASIEVEDGRRLAESLVKSLTGGDKVRARRMRQDFWQFDPTHKVFMAVNHKPEVRGTDTAIWRRLRLLPFEQTIPPAEQDKQLPEKLRGGTARDPRMGRRGLPRVAAGWSPGSGRGPQGNGTVPL